MGVKPILRPSTRVGDLLAGVGSGFSFAARQKRIQLDGDDFYIALLFYKRNLKRLVVVELKLGAFKPEYKSQVEPRLRWLAQNEREPDEKLPLGALLCSGKNSEQIELAELGTAGIHVAPNISLRCRRARYCVTNSILQLKPRGHASMQKAQPRL